MKLANPKKAAEAKAVQTATEAKIEKHFRSHPELPSGRDFRFNRERDPIADKKFKENFDRIFKSSPGYGF